MNVLFRIFISLFLLLGGFVYLYFFENNAFCFIIFSLSFLICGYDIVLNALKNMAKKELFDENFLMSIACFGALALNEAAEAAAIMIFYQIGEYFNDYAVVKSKEKISALLNLRPQLARIKKEQDFKEINIENAKVGDIMQIRAGERIGLDSIIINGTSFVDTSAITGESLPREVGVGSNLLAGYINKSGVLLAKVSKISQDSAICRILELVKNASQKKSKQEKFIRRFARIYTPIVVVLAGILAFILPIFLGDFSGWIHRALIFLVISCPCALVISVPLSFFAGIGAASTQGILFKGSAFIDTLARVKIFIFDKTGTLTKGVFKVSKIYAKDEKEFIYFSALATCNSNHPISKSLMQKYTEIFNNQLKENINAKELAGLGMQAFFDDKEILVGNAKLMYKFEVKNFNENLVENSGFSVVHLAINKQYIGSAIICDELKDDAKNLIKNLKENGAKCIMLTGDNEISAKKVSDELGMDKFYANLLPQDKISYLENEIKMVNNEKIAFIGDGINDAATLARADIGIALSGQDAATQAADVVIINNKPSSLIKAIKIAQKTKNIAMQNIVFAIFVKLGIMGLGAFGLANIWAAIFADVGVSVLCVLNAMRAGLNSHIFKKWHK